MPTTEGFKPFDKGVMPTVSNCCKLLLSCCQLLPAVPSCAQLLPSYLRLSSDSSSCRRSLR